MTQFHSEDSNFDSINGLKDALKGPITPDDTSKCNDLINQMYPMVNEAETSLPRQWSSKKLEKCPSLWLSQNDLRVHYKGVGKNIKDAASVRTAHIIPPACGIYYYEVKIISKGRDGYMGIGVTAVQKMDNRLPGWDKNSYGYHGDDGNVFCSSGNGLPYGPTFTTGDTIGCAINFIDSTSFYTKNGVNLGIAFKDLPNNLYPTVGLQTPGEILEANFGLLPFAYSIEDYKRSWQEKIYLNIKNYQITSSWTDWQTSMQKLVMSYLVNEGYSKSAESFSKSTNLEFNEDIESIHNRQKIIELVMRGRISEAIDKTQQLYPGFFERRRDLLFKLKCRQFVEMINGVDDVIQHKNMDAVTSFPNDAKPNGMMAQLDNKNDCLMSPVPSNGTSNGHEMDMDTTDSSISDCEEFIVANSDKKNLIADECAEKARSCLTDVSSIEKLLSFGRELHSLNTELKKEAATDPDLLHSKLLQDVFSLLAYTDPWSSPVGWQLQPQARQSISQNLNMALLEFLGLPKQCAFELVLGHTTQCIRTMAKAQLTQVAFISNQLPFTTIAVQ